MPKRIQRKRAKGWRMPEGVVYVGRGTAWGNRFKIGLHSNRLGRLVETSAEAVMLFRELQCHPVEMAGYRQFIQELLRGKDLACWCRLDQPCHAELLEIANA